MAKPSRRTASDDAYAGPWEEPDRLTRSAAVLGWLDHKAKYILLAGGALFVLCCAVAVPVGLYYYTSSATYSRLDFEASVVGLSPAQVRRKLGTPAQIEMIGTVDETDPANDGYWMYK